MDDRRWTIDDGPDGPYGPYGPYGRGRWTIDFNGQVDG